MTLAHIAQHAGCSKATVSLALRDSPKIKAETRAKLQRLAREMGYRPNPTLARIAARRWRTGFGRANETIACLSFRPFAKSRIPERQMAHPELRAMAEQRGFRFEMFYREDYDSIEALSRVWWNRGVGAVLFTQTYADSNEEDLRRFPWDRFAVVAVELGFHRPPAPLVRQDEMAAARVLYQKALAAGYERIGVVMATKRFSENDQTIEAGYLYARHLAERASHDPPLLNVGLTADRFDKVERWCREHQLDALLYHYADVRATWRRLRPRPGLGVLKVQPCDRISGVAAPRDLIAEAAVNLVADRLNRGDFGARENAPLIEIPGPWIEQGTL